MYVLIPSYPLKLVKALFTCWTLIKFSCLECPSVSRTSQTLPRTLPRTDPTVRPTPQKALLVPPFGCRSRAALRSRTVQAFAHFCLSPRPACLGEAVPRARGGVPVLCLASSRFCGLSQGQEARSRARAPGRQRLTRVWQSWDERSVVCSRSAFLPTSAPVLCRTLRSDRGDAEALPSLYSLRSRGQMCSLWRTELQSLHGVGPVKEKRCRELEKRVGDGGEGSLSGVAGEAPLRKRTPSRD